MVRLRSGEVEVANVRYLRRVLVQAMKVSFVWRMRWLIPSSSSSCSTTLAFVWAELTAAARFFGLFMTSSDLPADNCPGLISTSSSAFSFFDCSFTNGQLVGCVHPSELGGSSGIRCKVPRPPIPPRLYPDSPSWLSTVAKLYLEKEGQVKSQK